MYLHACKGIFRLLSARAWRVELGDFKEVPDMLNTETVAAYVLIYCPLFPPASSPPEQRLLRCWHWDN